MKSAVAFGVLKKLVAVIVELSAAVKIIVSIFCKIIIVDKVIACVVRWINVYHFDLAKISFLQKFEDIKVIALYVEIFGVVKINAFLTAGAESFSNRGICKQYRLFLVRPSELITFLFAVNNVGVYFLHKHVLVNGTDNFACGFIYCFGNCIREQLRELFIVLVSFVLGTHFKFCHLVFLQLP